MDTTITDGSGGKTPLIVPLNTGCRWMVSFTAAGKVPSFPLSRKTGGIQCQFGRTGGHKISFPFRYLNTISEFSSSILAIVLGVTENSLGDCDNGCASTVVSNAVVKVWLPCE